MTGSTDFDSSRFSAAKDTAAQSAKKTSARCEQPAVPAAYGYSFGHLRRFMSNEPLCGPRAFYWSLHSCNMAALHDTVLNPVTANEGCMSEQNPVIFVPGITATSLVDEYSLHTDDIWSMVFNRQFERVALHPDDLRYEAVEPARVQAGQLFPVYDDLIRALRYELSPRADQPTPVFPFRYDWRKDLADTAGELRDYVEEVLARTRLLPHYAECDDLKVDLVGHSMGGSLICEYLTQYGRRSRVGKVATIGTPYYGAAEAIVKVATGMSLLTGSEPREREREAARVTPSVYQLFPSYPAAVIGPDGDDVDVFDVDNMQRTVIDSLAEFVRLYSTSTPATQRLSKARKLLHDMLERARAHRSNITSFRLQDAGLRQRDWITVAGVGEPTRIELGTRNTRRGPRFVIEDDQFVNELSADGAVGPNSSLRTGDGTVPLVSALPPFLPASKVVCVTRDDLGRFELRDRLLVEVGGLHGLLPRVNLVQRLVICHLLPGYDGRIWGRRAPGTRRWRPPIAALTEREY